MYSQDDGDWLYKNKLEEEMMDKWEKSQATKGYFWLTCFFLAPVVLGALLFIYAVIAHAQDEGIVVGDLEPQQGTLMLGVLQGVNGAPGDYSPLQVDKEGALVFSCRNCPASMCKRMTCKGNNDPADYQFVFDCQCQDVVDFTCVGNLCH